MSAHIDPELLRASLRDEFVTRLAAHSEVAFHGAPQEQFDRQTALRRRLDALRAETSGATSSFARALEPYARIASEDVIAATFETVLVIVEGTPDWPSGLPQWTECRARSEQLPVFVFRIPGEPHLIEQLARQPGVVAVCADRRFEVPQPVGCESSPNDARRLIWPEGTWDKARSSGNGVRVAVLDSGIDAGHAAFSGRIAAMRSFVPGQDVDDKCGHGTHCAGIAAGAGLAHGRYMGVAPQASLLIGKVLSDAGFGQTSWIIRGLAWAAAEGAQVVSLSLGSGGRSDGSDPLSMACNALARSNIVVVSSAGNSGAREDISIPSDASEVICVGAVDERFALADFSSRGPAANGVQKPDIAAPGVRIAAPRSAKCELVALPGLPDYAALSGTSMAAPVVAGAAAVLIGEGVAGSGAAALIRDALRRPELCLKATVPDGEEPRYCVGAGVVAPALLIGELCDARDRSGALDVGLAAPPPTAAAVEEEHVGMRAPRSASLRLWTSMAAVIALAVLAWGAGRCTSSPFPLRTDFELGAIRPVLGEAQAAVTLRAPESFAEEAASIDPGSARLLKYYRGSDPPTRRESRSRARLPTVAKRTNSTIVPAAPVANATLEPVVARQALAYITKQYCAQARLSAEERIVLDAGPERLWGWTTAVDFETGGGSKAYLETEIPCPGKKSGRHRTSARPNGDELVVNVTGVFRGGEDVLIGFDISGDSDAGFVRAASGTLHVKTGSSSPGVFSALEVEPRGDGTDASLGLLPDLTGDGLPEVSVLYVGDAVPGVVARLEAHDMSVGPAGQKLFDVPVAEQLADVDRVCRARWMFERREGADRFDLLLEPVEAGCGATRLAPGLQRFTTRRGAAGRWTGGGADDLPSKNGGADLPTSEREKR